MHDHLADFYASPTYGLVDARHLRTRPAKLAAAIRAARVTLVPAIGVRR